MSEAIILINKKAKEVKGAMVIGERAYEIKQSEEIDIKKSENK